MKRYSISHVYSIDKKTNKVTFHYFGRTDSVEKAIEEYKENLMDWQKRIQDEDSEYRDLLKQYRGIKITDSQTKQVVYEDLHSSEEFGYRMNNGEWEKI